MELHIAVVLALFLWMGLTLLLLPLVWTTRVLADWYRGRKVVGKWNS